MHLCNLRRTKHQKTMTLTNVTYALTFDSKIPNLICTSSNKYVVMLRLPQVLSIFVTCLSNCSRCSYGFDRISKQVNRNNWICLHCRMSTPCAYQSTPDYTLIYPCICVSPLPSSLGLGLGLLSHQYDIKWVSIFTDKMTPTGCHCHVTHDIFLVLV